MFNQYKSNYYDKATLWKPVVDSLLVAKQKSIEGINKILFHLEKIKMKKEFSQINLKISACIYLISSIYLMVKMVAEISEAALLSVGIDKGAGNVRS